MHSLTKKFYLSLSLFIYGFCSLTAQDTIAVKGIDAALEAVGKGNYVSVLLATDTNSVFPERFFELPEDKVVGLIIDNCGYKHFPDELTRYQAIVYFRYSWFLFMDSPNNDFPAFTLKLKNLRELRIDRIEIPDVPKSIKRLKKLKHFELYACKMPAFPRAVLKLKQLQHLHLPCNNFTIIPEDIDRLKQLKTLSFEGGACGGTPIDKIPNSIGNLSDLEIFELGYSKKGVKELPTSFFGLKNIKRLECNGCGLEKLPEALGQLQKLEAISLMNIREFQAFPEAIYDLPSLKNFRYYQFKAPDERLLTQLSKLEEWGKNLEKYEFEINGIYEYPPKKR